MTARLSAITNHHNYYKKNKVTLKAKRNEKGQNLSTYRKTCKKRGKWVVVEWLNKETKMAVISPIVNYYGRPKISVEQRLAYLDRDNYEIIGGVSD